MIFLNRKIIRHNRNYLSPQLKDIVSIKAERENMCYLLKVSLVMKNTQNWIFFKKSICKTKECLCHHRIRKIVEYLKKNVTIFFFEYKLNSPRK